VLVSIRDEKMRRISWIISGVSEMRQSVMEGHDVPDGCFRASGGR
jgi:hypothetical protein